MPEGDTVWLTAKRLHLALAGRVLSRCEFRVPRLAAVDLAGVEVEQVAPRGKHLLLRLEGGRTLHAHLRMDGSWYVTRNGVRARHGPDHAIRVVLENAHWRATGYRIHDLRLLDAAAESELVGHLGPDLLGPDWNLDRAVANLAAQPARMIAEALLDQRNLAGIGNMYCAELLFLTGTHPRTPAAAVDLAAAVTIGRRLLLANRDHPEQSTTGTTRRGEEHWVYRRERQPCRRCRTPIGVARMGRPPHSRTSYWCPRCQPAPTAADR